MSTTQTKMVETRRGRVFVRKGQIIGTRTTAFSAYEESVPGPGDFLAGHSFVMSASDFPGCDARTAWLGLLGTGRLPADVDALPGGSDERIAACRALRAAAHADAYEAIVAAFPEAACGARRDGGIEVQA